MGLSFYNRAVFVFIYTVRNRRVILAGRERLRGHFNVNAGAGRYKGVATRVGGRRAADAALRRSMDPTSSRR